jgi:ABC-type multidrug transport system ATPase subunit
MSEPDVLVQLRSVEKRYKHETVLRVEDLALRDGETVIVTGQNGSGKSTLARILAGAVLPSRGTVARSRLLRRSILGLLPQSGGLYGELTVEQNVLLRCRLFGVALTRVGALPLVERFGLADLVHKRYEDLSGGFQRLASLVAVLSVRPDWLVLDEPLTGLDSAKRQTVLAVVGELRASLLLVVLTTPNAEEVPAWGRRVVVEGGHVPCALP